MDHPITNVIYYDTTFSTVLAKLNFLPANETAGSASEYDKAEYKPEEPGWDEPAGKEEW